MTPPPRQGVLELTDTRPTLGQTCLDGMSFLNSANGLSAKNRMSATFPALIPAMFHATHKQFGLLHLDRNLDDLEEDVADLCHDGPLSEGLKITERGIQKFFFVGEG